MSRGDLVAQVHEHGEVLTTNYTAKGTVIEATAGEKLLGQVEKFCLTEWFRQDLITRVHVADAKSGTLR